jgi:hypothetical protein
LIFPAQEGDADAAPKEISSWWACWHGHGVTLSYIRIWSSMHIYLCIYIYMIIIIIYIRIYILGEMYEDVLDLNDNIW